MLSRSISAAGAALALALAGSALGTQEAQPTPTPAPAAAPAACADCHEEAKVFSANPHALRRGAPAGDLACASCHGDGTKHIETSGDKAFIGVVRGGSGAEVCITCHTSSSAHTSFATGVHARGETVSCLTCHSIHASSKKQPRLLVNTPDALCASCHETHEASFRAKPFAHRLGRGGMSCVSCHDPHGVKEKSALKLTRAEEQPCLSCHAEKRGPFVFPHVTGVAGDCLTCHEAHGSSNPKRLTRSTVLQLCLECHSTLAAGLLGSQPPATHDLLSPRYRNCTTCHVAVHGSNRSPRLLK